MSSDLGPNHEEILAGRPLYLTCARRCEADSARAGRGGLGRVSAGERAAGGCTYIGEGGGCYLLCPIYLQGGAFYHTQQLPHSTPCRSAAHPAASPPRSFGWFRFVDEITEKNEIAEKNEKGQNSRPLLKRTGSRAPCDSPRGVWIVSRRCVCVSCVISCPCRRPFSFASASYGTVRPSSRVLASALSLPCLQSTALLPLQHALHFAPRYPRHSDQPP